MRHGDPRVKMWEFETSDDYIAYKFQDVLNNMHVTMPDVYIQPSYVGSSTIKFLCNPKMRRTIEYVFRRYMNFSRLYLSDLDAYQNNQHKYMEDKYAIY